MIQGRTKKKNTPCTRYPDCDYNLRALDRTYRVPCEYCNRAKHEKEYSKDKPHPDMGKSKFRVRQQYVTWVEYDVVANSKVEAQGAINVSVVLIR